MEPKKVGPKVGRRGPRSRVWMDSVRGMDLNAGWESAWLLTVRRGGVGPNMAGQAGPEAEEEG